MAVYSLLSEAKNERGKLTQKSARERLLAMEGDSDEESAAEREVLKRYITLTEEESAADKQLKEAQKTLERLIAAKYNKLDEQAIKTLVIEDRWLAALTASMDGEIDQLSQALAGRVRALEERYATPLPALVAEVERLAARVEEHLQKMGAV